MSLQPHPLDPREPVPRQCKACGLFRPAADFEHAVQLHGITPCATCIHDAWARGRLAQQLLRGIPEPGKAEGDEPEMRYQYLGGGGSGRGHKFEMERLVRLVEREEKEEEERMDRTYRLGWVCAVAAVVVGIWMFMWERPELCRSWLVRLGIESSAPVLCREDGEL
ncbi:hypothetical protein F5B20DRAFT_579961 [Whalleya microplaca]|nr:hypothetical protein F5B20DRAFT_579961 [Whalleya microplaca]